MKMLLIFIFLFCSIMSMAQSPIEEKMTPKMTENWDKNVAVVTPGQQPQDAPSDAIVLFNGTKESLMQNWYSIDKNEPKWIVENNFLTVLNGSGNIQTKESYEDIQLHIEWRTPAEAQNEGQNRGNSGIFFQSRYELQILDNFENPTYTNGQAGSIYKQFTPLVNACKKPGEWQYYDVIYIAPRFKKDGSVFSPAQITVLQNGVLVENGVRLLGQTEYIGIPSYKAHGAAPIILQDHNCSVSFRNIWIRDL